MGDCQMDVVNCGTISVDGKNYRIQSNSSKGIQQPAVSSPQGHVEDIEDERKGVHKGLRRGLVEDEHEGASFCLFCPPETCIAP